MAEGSTNNSVDVLVITDHFPSLSQAFPCKDQTAKQLALILWDLFFCFYGFCERIYSNGDANFESWLISELPQVSGVQKSHTTLYHSLETESVDGFNQTLGGMVCTPWGEGCLAVAASDVHVNCTAHEMTGHPPVCL